MLQPALGPAVAEGWSRVRAGLSDLGLELVCGVDGACGDDVFAVGDGACVCIASACGSVHVACGHSLLHNGVHVCVHVYDAVLHVRSLRV